MWLKLTCKSGEEIYMNMDLIECVEGTDGETKSQLIIHNHPEGHSYAVRETPEQIGQMINAVGTTRVPTSNGSWSVAADSPKQPVPIVPKW